MPSPPSRMPSVEDSSSLGMSIRSGLPRMKSNIEGGAMRGFKEPFWDFIKKMGKNAGKPFEKNVGVNPFTLGFDLGNKVIAPALMKVIPPPKRGRGVHMLGGQRGMRTMGSGLAKDA